MTCHFVDDRVMPGTLMYECCLHTLRIFLARMGWIGEEGEVACQPVPGVASKLKCRGQVIESTRTVTYEVSLKEIGYRPEPYVIVDALMFADGKPIVEITDMSLRMTGLDRPRLERIWATHRSGMNDEVSFRWTMDDRARVIARSHAPRGNAVDAHASTWFALAVSNQGRGASKTAFPRGAWERVKVESPLRHLENPRLRHRQAVRGVRRALPDLRSRGGSSPGCRVRPTSSSTGSSRSPASPGRWSPGRGPSPSTTSRPTPGISTPTARTSCRSPCLLETALQPCGWLAAYVGSALTSDVDLSFRNLGGSAVQLERVDRDTGTLTTEATLTRVSKSGGMIIQSYDFAMTASGRPVYRGETTFGFFSKQALANQVGIRDAQPWVEPGPDRGESFDVPRRAAVPGRRWGMIDRVEEYHAKGGPHGLGSIVGTKRVDPQEWFFAAHFFQDPVCPGSLGLESFQQLLKVVASRRWGVDPATPVRVDRPGRPAPLDVSGPDPADRHLVTVRAVVTAVDDAEGWLKADGFLDVDGRVIYQMVDFTLRIGRMGR